MKVKLIKDDNLYGLKDGDKIIGTCDDELNSLLNYPFRLSIKNCQAIERGYDLDELAEECADQYADRFDYTDGHGNREVYSNRDEIEKVYTIAFQKALELIGDKKFSEEDVLKAVEMYYEKKKIFIEIIQSLQQTEWDCIVEMEYIGKCNGNNGDGCFQESPEHNCGCFERNPKLDADGCLILKLKSE